MNHMGKLNKTFQRLRRERRMNFSDISKKCKIPIARIKELDEEAEFANIELASICDALGLSIAEFFKESEITEMDSPFVIKVKIQGSPKESELYQAICEVEADMNNYYDPKRCGWKHNSFNEAVVVLENARNYLSSLCLIPPTYYRESFLVAVLSFVNDHAYIEGKTTVRVSFGPEDDLYDSMDLMVDDPFDDLDDFRDFDNDLY